MNRDAFILEGRAFSWRHLCEMRRAQLEAAREARGTQPALFALHTDCRPASEKTAGGRYAAPSLWDGADGRATRDIPP